MGLNGDCAAERPRVLERGSQRERLLAAMALAVTERGYAATAVADVLKAARISRRTFYEIFADKEDCFLAAYDAFADACVERVRDAFDAEPDWRAGMARACEALLGALAAEPEFAHLAIAEILAAGPPGLARRDAVLRQLAGVVADAAGAPDPLLAQAVAGGAYELILARVVRGEAERLPELAGELTRCALLLLGVAAGAPSG